MLLVVLLISAMFGSLKLDDRRYADNFRSKKFYLYFYNQNFQTQAMHPITRVRSNAAQLITSVSEL